MMTPLFLFAALGLSSIIHNGLAAKSMGMGGGTAPPGTPCIDACGYWDASGEWIKSFKLSSLTLRYLGYNANDLGARHSELPQTPLGEQAQPDDDLFITTPGPGGVNPVSITSSQPDLATDNNMGSISINETWTWSGRFSSSLDIFASHGGRSWQVTFHSSCSHPIQAGDRYGYIEIVSHINDAGCDSNDWITTTAAPPTQPPPTQPPPTLPPVAAPNPTPPPTATTTAAGGPVVLGGGGETTTTLVGGVVVSNGLLDNGTGDDATTQDAVPNKSSGGNDEWWFLLLLLLVGGFLMRGAAARPDGAKGEADLGMPEEMMAGIVPLPLGDALQEMENGAVCASPEVFTAVHTANPLPAVLLPAALAPASASPTAGGHVGVVGPAGHAPGPVLAGAVLAGTTTAGAGSGGDGGGSAQPVPAGDVGNATLVPNDGLSSIAAASPLAAVVPMTAGQKAHNAPSPFAPLLVGSLAIPVHGTTNGNTMGGDLGAAHPAGNTTNCATSAINTISPEDFAPLLPGGAAVPTHGTMTQPYGDNPGEGAEPAGSGAHVAGTGANPHWLAPLRTPVHAAGGTPVATARRVANVAPDALLAPSVLSGPSGAARSGTATSMHADPASSNGSHQHGATRAGTGMLGVGASSAMPASTRNTDKSRNAGLSDGHGQPSQVGTAVATRRRNEAMGPRPNSVFLHGYDPTSSSVDDTTKPSAALHGEPTGNGVHGAHVHGSPSTGKRAVGSKLPQWPPVRDTDKADNSNSVGLPRWPPTQDTRADVMTAQRHRNDAFVGVRGAPHDSGVAVPGLFDQEQPSAQESTSNVQTALRAPNSGDIHDGMSSSISQSPDVPAAYLGHGMPNDGDPGARAPAPTPDVEPVTGCMAHPHDGPGVHSATRVQNMHSTDDGPGDSSPLGVPEASVAELQQAMQGLMAAPEIPPWVPRTKSLTRLYKANFKATAAAVKAVNTVGALDAKQHALQENSCASRSTTPTQPVKNSNVAVARSDTSVHHTPSDPYTAINPTIHPQGSPSGTAHAARVPVKVAATATRTKAQVKAARKARQATNTALKAVAAAQTARSKLHASLAERARSADNHTGHTAETGKDRIQRARMQLEDLTAAEEDCTSHDAGIAGAIAGGVMGHARKEHNASTDEYGAVAGFVEDPDGNIRVKSVVRTNPLYLAQMDRNSMCSTSETCDDMDANVMAPFKFAHRERNVVTNQGFAPTVAEDEEA